MFIHQCNSSTASFLFNWTINLTQINISEKSSNSTKTECSRVQKDSLSWAQPNFSYTVIYPETQLIQSTLKHMARRKEQNKNSKLERGLLEYTNGHTRHPVTTKPTLMMSGLPSCVIWTKYLFVSPTRWSVLPREVVKKAYIPKVVVNPSPAFTCHHSSPVGLSIIKYYIL